jgi:membrane protease YdiL (CAAX protease family)
MTDVPTPSRRGFFGTLTRIGLLRIFVMGFILVTCIGLTMAFHGEYSLRRTPLPYSPIVDYGGTAILCLGLVGVYALLVRLFERRWPAEARPAPGWTVLGIAFGLGLFCAVYALLTMMGVAHFDGVNGFAKIGPVFLMALISGVGEELMFRGVLFRVLEDSLGTTIALIFSAAVFGLLHGANHGATLVSTIAIAVEAGGLLAAAYAWSRSLWLVFGLHFAWNFTEGGMFGAAVSGGAAKGVLNFPLSAKAPILLTGGEFGPEASVVAVIICTSLAALFVVLAIRAGKWRGLRFRPLLG